jgi:hypothetical protein
MKRLTASTFVLGLALSLASCSSSGGTVQQDQRWFDPGPLLKQRIEESISQIPYQHRDELLNNMLWIAQQGEAAIPFLLKSLDSDNAKTRSSAAWMLGRIGDRRILPDLRKHASEPNLIVRLEIARTMLDLGDLQMVPELIVGLDSEEQHVRYLCHDALKSATGKDFGYDHRAKSSAERRESLAKWQEWWTERGEGDWFQQSTQPGTEGVPAAPTGR